MSKIKNIYKTFGARVSLIVKSKRLTQSKKDWIKIIMDYKKNVL